MNRVYPNITRLSPLYKWATDIREMFPNSECPYTSYSRPIIFLVAGPLNHSCNSSVLANNPTSDGVYFLGNRCLPYSIFFSCPVCLYLLINLDTCALEYPVILSIYRRITPFSSLLGRWYLNLISTSFIQQYLSSVVRPLNSIASLPSRNCLTCSIVCDYSSFIISCMSQS